MMVAPPNNVRHVLHMQQQQKLAQRQQQQLAQRRQAAAAGLAGVPQLRMPGAQAGNGGTAGGGAFQQVVYSGCVANLLLPPSIVALLIHDVI